MKNNFKSILLIILISFQILSCKSDSKIDSRTLLQSLKHEKNEINKCLKYPEFAKNYGLTTPYEINMEWQKITIIGARKRKVHLDDWDRFGQLGKTCFDKSGNIFTFPRPFLNLFTNPPKEQNKILIINSKSAKMNNFISFDNSLPPNNNPFGVMDIKYDCSKDYLYASSIYGSDYKNDMGNIYIIDRNSKKIHDIFEGIDALSIGLFIEKSGKKLYFGSARKPYLYSIHIDKDGKFDNNKKLELKLNKYDKGTQDNVINIKFEKDRMYLEMMPFTYSMFAAADPNRTILEFKYIISTDSWDFVAKYKKFR